MTILQTFIKNVMCMIAPFDYSEPTPKWFRIAWKNEEMRKKLDDFVR